MGDRGIIGITNTHIHDRSLPWLVKGTSIKGHVHVFHM